ncbi:MAG: TonB-dependent receptor, partial [Bacteroidales bacterium]|nr:TonB-dependent receptor [Bacteroidales bacterium]
SECTGEVVDETGEPLIGATVRVVDTTIAGATDLEGRFNLKGVKVGATLQVSYIGYNSKTVVWDGKPITITLAEDSHTLEEVVVMGYGIAQKRANVTNSIAKVSEETLTVGANANPAQALAGAVSGVKVNITSGDPSATPSIVIRGGTDWNGANDPLVVVDGQIRSSLSDINPNDIGDMQILKDAGATALYGARAANGVILITTKQGKKGSAQVTLNAKVGLNWYNDTGYEFLGAEDFLKVYRKAAVNTPWFSPDIWGANTGSIAAAVGSTSMSASSWWNVMTLTDENKYYVTNHGWKTMKDVVPDSNGNYRDIIYKETDPLGYNLNTPVYTQDYNLSFSGGNDQGTYYASLGYYDADGAFKGTYYKRYNFALTGSYKIAPWLEANSQFNYIRANWLNTLPTASGYTNEKFFGRVASMPPVIRLQDEEGNQLHGNGGINLKYQPEAFERDYQSDKFQMTQGLTIKIIDGLTVRGTMSWYYNEEYDESFNHDYKNQNGATVSTRASSASFERYFNQTYNVVANFNRTFNEKHDVNAMLGMEYYKGRYRGFDASGNGAPTDEYADLALTFAGEAYLQTNGSLYYRASSRSIDSWHYEDAILSYMGRFEYNYDGKYHIAATFREDGYSRLVNNRWGFFPGVSAGWTFSREKFWQESGLDWINYGKLRGSFGMNGIVNPDVIGYYTLYGSYSAYKYNGQYGYRIAGLPNPDLRWEKTRTFEVGLDFGFLQDRFQLGLTYYNRLTMDKYANKSLPPTTGFSSVVNNNGKFRNQGLEIDVTATLYRNRDWSWTLGANLTYNKNKVVELPENDNPNFAQNATVVYLNGQKDADGNYLTQYIGGLQVGQEPNHLVGYKAAKMLRSQAEVEALGDYIDIVGWSTTASYSYATEAGRQRLLKLGYKESSFHQLEPGDMVWMDRNGDNMVDTYDQYDLGNLSPHWTGGFNTTLRWKDFSLYARFDMGWGFTVYDSFMAWTLGAGQGGYNVLTQVKDTWSEDNPNAKYPRYTIADQLGNVNYFRVSDLWSNSGAYLAVRELQLSYSLPAKLCSKFYCKGLTVSVTGQNLGYWKSCTNPLPDKSETSSANENATYNLPKTLLFGVNVSF